MISVQHLVEIVRRDDCTDVEGGVITRPHDLNIRLCRIASIGLRQNKRLRHDSSCAHASTERKDGRSVT
jgi:hypothetical protein